MRKPKERRLPMHADRPVPELAPNAPEYGGCLVRVASVNTQGPISSSFGSQPVGEYLGHWIILPLSCEPLEQGGGPQGIIID